MCNRTLVSARTLVVLTLLLLLCQSAGATEVTWSYSGQITYTDFPEDFPLGAPVHLSVTVDPDLQLLVSATATFNGFSYGMTGPRPLSYVGLVGGFHSYYVSGLAAGPSVGSFTPWFSTLFFRGESAPFSADPFFWAQSFVFEDAFGAAIGASGMTVDLPTPEELLSELIERVSALSVRAGISNSLNAKLSAVRSAIDDNNVENDVAARNTLLAFISAVEAHRGNQVSDADATLLVAAAERIIVALGG